MKNNNLQIGDLISLDGLEKPQGVLTRELGGVGEKSENVNQLRKRMSDFAGTIEDQEDVQVGEVAGLVEVLKNAMKRELLPEKAKKLLKTLRTRFENKKNMKNRHPGMEWKEVQAKLEASPEKLWSLNEMESTGGEPDVLKYNDYGKTGEYIFYDCSAESPTERRNCVYDREGEEKLKKDYPGEKCKSNAVSRAALMGVNLLTESEYRYLQTKGKFDKNSRSWLQTPIDERKFGGALFGRRTADGAGVVVIKGSSSVRGDNRAFRSSLRV